VRKGKGKRKVGRGCARLLAERKRPVAAGSAAVWAGRSWVSPVRPGLSLFGKCAVRGARWLLDELGG
jgi:hypothetical protein